MRRTILIVLGILVLVVGGFFAFRAYTSAQASSGTTYQTVKVTRGDLTASVGATGTVRSKQSVMLNWQTTGQVAQVNAKQGDGVKKGQLLATLDEKSLAQNVIMARSDLVTAQRNLDQLLNSDLARSQAEQTLVQAQKDLDTAQTQRQSKQYARATDANVEQARANYILAHDNTKRANSAYDHFRGLPEDDPNRAASYAQLAAAQQKEATALANLNWLLGRPDNMEIAQADSALAVAQAKVKDAQREYARLQNGADPNDIAAAKARIASLQATLDNINLVSPIDGIVTTTNVQVGDQASMTAAAFRIDDLSSLLVDVQITEVDINRIKIGQPTSLSFDAITDKQYSGKITQVSKVGQSVQGVVNFTVTVQIDNPDDQVRPGMTAAVSIITDLVQNALVVPSRAVRQNNGQRVVFVLRNKVPVMVQIQTGRQADVNIEVIGGDVKEGDLLVLNPPTSLFGAGGAFSGGRPGGAAGGN